MLSLLSGKRNVRLSFSYFLAKGIHLTAYNQGQYRNTIAIHRPRNILVAFNMDAIYAKIAEETIKFDADDDVVSECFQLLTLPLTEYLELEESVRAIVCRASGKCPRHPR